MIIDSSAIVAIVTREPAADRCLAALLVAPVRRMSAASVLETAIVLSRVHDDTFVREFDDLTDLTNIIIIKPVTAHQAQLARSPSSLRARQRPPRPPERRGLLRLRAGEGV